MILEWPILLPSSSRQFRFQTQAREMLRLSTCYERKGGRLTRKDKAKGGGENRNVMGQRIAY